MVKRKYKCNICRVEYISYRKEECMIKEMEKNFGEVMKEDRRSVCDDCYKIFMEWYKEKYLN